MKKHQQACSQHLEKQAWNDSMYCSYLLITFLNKNKKKKKKKKKHQEEEEEEEEEEETVKGSDTMSNTTY
jgi:hypothetical protein